MPSCRTKPCRASGLPLRCCAAERGRRQRAWLPVQHTTARDTAEREASTSWCATSSSSASRTQLTPNVCEEARSGRAPNNRWSFGTRASRACPPLQPSARQRHGGSPGRRFAAPNLLRWSRAACSASKSARAAAAARRKRYDGSHECRGRRCDAAAGSGSPRRRLWILSHGYPPLTAGRSAQTATRTTSVWRRLHGGGLREIGAAKFTGSVRARLQCDLREQRQPPATRLRDAPCGKISRVTTAGRVQGRRALWIKSYSANTGAPPSPMGRAGALVGASRAVPRVTEMGRRRTAPCLRAPQGRCAGMHGWVASGGACGLVCFGQSRGHSAEGRRCMLAGHAVHRSTTASSGHLKQLSYAR